MKKKILLAIIVCLIGILVCACGGSGNASQSNEKADEDKTEETSSTELMGESVEIFNTDDGVLTYVGIEKAVPEFTDDDEDNAYIVVFDFTNKKEEKSQVQNVFWTQFFQNGVEFTDYPSYNSKAGEQYDLACALFNEALKGGTIRYGQAIIPKDDSPVTIITTLQSDNETTKQIEIDLSNGKLTGGSDETGEAEAAGAKSSDHVTLEGVYVNDSYKDKENDSVKMLYAFYDVHTDDTNIKTDTIIDLKTDNNTYTADVYKADSGCNYMSSYYHSKYLTDILTGENKKMLAIFKVPEAEISGDGSFYLADDDIADMENIVISNSDVIHCKNYKEIAKKADPKGYKKEKKAQKKADDATTTKVKNGINGYKWDFYVNDTSYTIEFFAPDTFTMKIMGTQTTDGKYTVKNGYVSVKNNSNGVVVDIPWVEENNEIDLKPQYAYDVSR